MRYAKRFACLLAFWLCALGFSAQTELYDLSKLRDCDLLFHVSTEENAITSVTEGTNQQKIDHVAIFLYLDNQPYVIEAIEEGVVFTPLDSVLRRDGYHLVGRVRGTLDRASTLNRAKALLGRSYDHLYLSDNTPIYCSELVQLSFVRPDGKEVFGTIPMTFTNTDGSTLPYWTDFYAEHGMAVPEGQPGTNPGELSRRKCVKVKYMIKRQGARSKIGGDER